MRLSNCLVEVSGYFLVGIYVRDFDFCFPCLLFSAIEQTIVGKEDTEAFIFIFIFPFFLDFLEVNGV